MKNALFIIGLSLISQSLLSQHFNESLLQIRDSLRTELNNSKDESSSVEILRQITLTFEYIDTDSVIYHGQKFIEAAEKFQDNNRLLDALGIVGGAYIYKGDLPKALELLLRAIQINENNPGLISTSSIPGIGPAYDYLSEIYFQIGDMKMAHKYADEEVNLPVANKFGIGFGHFKKARIFESTNHLDSALEHLNLSMRIFEESVAELSFISDKYDANPEGYNLLAKIYLKQGKPALALAELKNILGINILKGETLNTAITYNDLAHYFSIQGIPDSSIYFAEKALKESEKIEFVKGKLDACTLLAQKYELTDPIKALDYYKLATSIQNDLYGAGNVQVLKDMIAQKEKEKETLELAQSNYQNKLKQYLLSAGLLVFLLIATIFFRNDKKSKAANLILEKTLSDLKATQSQLIQSEKMASLGELTAGIAHEIQNPLNFVNNFSEVSNELIDEMKEELEKGDSEEALAIADDIKGNLEKINHHGKRADAIVKGMLQHSRTSSGQKEPTDINALCDEYLRLSYHACLAGRQGLRAKDKNFNADFQTNFDTDLPKVNVISQDISRVLLNLINNAFYAVNERYQKVDESFKPTVSVSTKKLEDKIEISVSDNGSGIPDAIKEKIFQPFFTTKPTGQGTGLGLSLSYDIVKAHGGELKVESPPAGVAGIEGKGTIFIISLPT